MFKSVNTWNCSDDDDDDDDDVDVIVVAAAVRGRQLH